MKSQIARICATIAMCISLASAQQLFDIKPVADGVYAALAKPAYKTNCNAAIIMLDDGVLVVDTHSKPSAARGLIAQIKQLTDKPVLEERNVRKGFLKDSEYIRLADTTAKEETAKLRPWLRGMFESGWCYGWREDEIQSLRVRQFDPIARIILLEPGETKNDVPRQTPPMDETIYQLISACTVGKNPDDFIFTRDDGEPIKDFRVAFRPIQHHELR